MAEVPVNLNKLEEIATTVASELLEELVIDNDVDESELPNMANLAVKVTMFVIDRYMYHVNNALDEQARRLAE